MAGYERPRKKYLLQFEDEEYAGLEVRAYGASVAEVMNLMDLSRFFGRGDFKVEDIKEVDGLFNLFGSKLIEWNLTEDGEPITFEPREFVDPSFVDAKTFVPIVQRETPAQAKARVLKDQEMDFAITLMFAWLEAVIGTPAPLDERSSNGEQLEEASIPMETSSESLTV